MKKILTVLLCTFVSFFVNVSADNTNIYVETKNLNEKILAKSIIETRNDEQETIEKEQEIIEIKQEETNESYVAETSTPNEYVEEVNTVNETYNVPSVNYGTYGRLYVSWYDVALYDYNVYTESSYSLQQLVDNYDSAAYYASHDRLVIADHNTQGFNVLYGLSEGTVSYIKFADGSSIAYRLIRKETGYNTGPDLVDAYGNSFFDMDSNLIMYTCYGDGIMVTLWVLA